MDKADDQVDAAISADNKADSQAEAAIAEAKESDLHVNSVTLEVRRSACLCSYACLLNSTLCIQCYDRVSKALADPDMDWATRCGVQQDAELRIAAARAGVAASESAVKLALAQARAATDKANDAVEKVTVCLL